MFQCVPPEVYQLYSCLEVDFNPLTLCRKVKPLLEFLSANDDTTVYIEPLKQVTLVRFVKQVRKKERMML